jgi:hypothetical protein
MRHSLVFAAAPAGLAAGAPAWAVERCEPNGFRDDEVFEDGSRKAFGT